MDANIVGFFCFIVLNFGLVVLEQYEDDLLYFNEAALIV